MQKVDRSQWLRISAVIECLMTCVMLALLVGCGGGTMSTRNPTGIIVQSTPANQTAYSGQPIRKIKSLLLR